MRNKQDTQKTQHTQGTDLRVYFFFDDSLACTGVQHNNLEIENVSKTDGGARSQQILHRERGKKDRHITTYNNHIFFLRPGGMTC